MGQKFLDGLGKTPKVATALTEAQKRVLARDEWFAEYTNTDTRNAIAQGLELVDHGGDSIFYSGAERHGFKVSFDQVMYLVNSKHMGVFKFIVYHKTPNERIYHVWQMNRKAPEETLKKHSRTGHVKSGAL